MAAGLLGEAAGGETLAIDLGSSSVRAVVFDEELEAVDGGLARRPVQMRIRAGGVAELHPDSYVDALCACLDELHQLGGLSAVAAVAVASQWHSILAVGSDGRPRGPALTWADTRASCSGVAKDLVDFHTRTGTWPHSLYWTARIPWLAEEVAGAVRYLGLAEYVGRRLLDDDAVSLSLASGTGLFNLHARTWDAEALALAGVSDALLPPLASSGWEGRLSRRWRLRWPELADAAWAPALGDGAASNLGAGCTDRHRISVTIGTSAAARVVHQRVDKPLSPKLWRYVVDETRFVTGMASSAGGNLDAWGRGLVDGPADAVLGELAPGSTTAVALPFFAGSRPPDVVDAGRGAFAGLSLATTAIDLRAALLESVCFELASGVDELVSLIDQRAEIVLNGGALVASRWWQRALAALFEHPVFVCPVREMAARGAAIFARGVDAKPSLEPLALNAADRERMRRSRHRYDLLRTRGESDSATL